MQIGSRGFLPYTKIFSPVLISVEFDAIKEDFIDSLAFFVQLLIGPLFLLFFTKSFFNSSSFSKAKWQWLRRGREIETPIRPQKMEFIPKPWESPRTW